MSTLFDASLFARSWLAVGVAAGKEKLRPQFDRTTLIELYPEGARFTASDGIMILTSFVPAKGRYTEDEPGLDEAPVFTAIAQDPAGRGRSLLGHLLGLAKQAEESESGDEIDVRMSLGVLEEDEPGTFEGFEIPWVVLEHPDHERLKLRTYEGSFPQWRDILAEFKPRSTKSIALNPEVIGRLAKLGTYIPSAIEWRFGGLKAAAMVEISDEYSGLTVRGAVMPVAIEVDQIEEQAA